LLADDAEVALQKPNVFVCAAEHRRLHESLVQTVSVIRGAPQEIECFRQRFLTAALLGQVYTQETLERERGRIQGAGGAQFGLAFRQSPHGSQRDSLPMSS